jgi:hypothetical protein
MIPIPSDDEVRHCMEPLDPGFEYPKKPDYLALLQGSAAS